MSRRIRLAYFVPASASFAGMERVVHEIADEIARTRSDLFEVHVLYGSRYPKGSPVEQHYTRHLVEMGRLRSSIGALRNWLRSNQIQVLVCPQVEPTVVAWVAARSIGLPVFITHLHGNPQIEWQEGTLRTKLSFLAFKYLISPRISATLAVAPKLQAYTKEAIVRKCDVYYVKNPAQRAIQADLDFDASVREPSNFAFLNVARLSRQKGLDILLRAFKEVIRDTPRASLTLVGSGPDEITLRDLAIQLGIGDRVMFAGQQEDVAAYYSSADCFVLSSRWEGFPLVLLEALSHGLPIIATNCDFGPADLICDHRLGRLVPPDDPHALAQAMKEAQRQQHSHDDRVFRRRISAQYSPEVAAKSHTIVLEQILASTQIL